MHSNSPEFPWPSTRFTVLAAASSLVCVALMVLWIHSSRANDVLVLPKQAGDHWLVTSAFGTFNVQWEASQKGKILSGWVFIENRLPRNWPNDWSWFYFNTYRGRTRHFLFLRAAPIYGVSVPHWFLIGLMGIAPARWANRFRRARRGRWQFDHGLCPRCAYDMRASAVAGGPLLQTCPECGWRGNGKGSRDTPLAASRT